MDEHPTNHGAPKIFCFVLIALLATCVFVDRVAPFVLPRSAYYFRPWEHMTGGHRYGIPRTGESITMNGYGDLANMLGVSSFRSRREITFTMDEEGHRNAPGTQHTDPEVLVVGNSFITGAGNTDEETFTSQLQRGTDLKITAYAPVNMSVFLAENMESPKVVILGIVERNLLGFNGEIIKLNADTSCFREVSEREQRIEAVKDSVKTVIKNFVEYAQLSLLRRLSQQLYQEMRFALTGKHSPNVVIGKDGKTLFFSKAVRLRNHDAQDRKLGKVVDAIIHVRNCLSERGIEFIFIPIPDKANIYADAVHDDIGWVSPEPLEQLHDALRAEGVTVVPLLLAFRSAKEEGKQLYWSDDTHWNQEGIGLAVEEVLKVLD